MPNSWPFADNDICLITTAAPRLAVGLGSLGNLTLWYLGYKNIFCWLKPVPCGNVLMWSLKHVLRKAVNTYSSLSGLYSVRNTPELSFCQWFTTLSPIYLQIWLSCVQWSRGSWIGGGGASSTLLLHRQFPSDKSLNQLPCSEARTPIPCHLTIHLQKARSPHDEHRGTPTEHMESGGWLRVPSTKNFKRKSKKQQWKDNFYIIHTLKVIF